MTLTKTKGNLTLTVDWSEKDQDYEIISLEADGLDITAIAEDHFYNDFIKLFENVDWHDLATDEKHERRYADC